MLFQFCIHLNACMQVYSYIDNALGNWFYNSKRFEPRSYLLGCNLDCPGEMSPEKDCW